jgi:hypothetical protein
LGKKKRAKKIREKGQKKRTTLSVLLGDRKKKPKNYGKKKLPCPNHKLPNCPLARQPKRLNARMVEKILLSEPDCGL